MSEFEANVAAVTSAPSVTELTIDLEKLEPLLSTKWCIYRVPSNIRRVNEAAYTPHCVSIGPLHYGDKNLKKMEKHKLRYLEIFLKSSEVRGKSLDDFVLFVKDNEERIRRSYAETFDHLNSDQFARMILVDASFIIVHIRRISHTGGTQDCHKLIFDIPVLASSAFQDLVLLENQLPFFILERLWGMVFQDDPFSMIHKFFNDLNRQGKPMTKHFKHLTDLVRYYQLPKEEKKEQPESPTVNIVRKIDERCDSSTPLLRENYLAHTHGSDYLYSATEPHEAGVRFQNPGGAKQSDNKGNVDYLPSATELYEAGVRFKVSESKCQLDITFNDGVLEMPCFTIKDETDALFRNVMALEQCHYLDNERPVCEWIKLMNYLINTDKDVKILVQKKILVHQLGGNHEVASLVNKLGVEIIYNPEKSRYSETVGKLNKYYGVRYHTWIATLSLVYFKTPWRSASTVAAITLLLLTVAQTVCSFLSL